MLIISDILWNEIKQILPIKKSKVGRSPKDSRMVLSGVFYIMITGPRPMAQIARLLREANDGARPVQNLGKIWIFL